MTHRPAVAALAVTAALVAVTACGTTNDRAQCKQAIAEQLSRDIATDLNGGTVPDTYDRPAACAGLDKATIEQINNEVINEAVQRAIDGGTP